MKNQIIRQYEMTLTFNAVRLHLLDKRYLEDTAKYMREKRWSPPSERGRRKGLKWYNRKEKVIDYQRAVLLLTKKWKLDQNVTKILQKNDGSIRERFLEAVSRHVKENPKLSSSVGSRFFNKIIIALAQYGMKFTAGKFKRIRCNRPINYIENFIIDYKTLFFDKYGHLITKVHVTPQPHRLFQNAYTKKGRGKVQRIVTKVHFRYLANGKYVNKFRETLKYNRNLISAANHRIDF
jgi:hypothetical protein